jgi:hypothetical protein
MNRTATNAVDAVIARCADIVVVAQKAVILVLVEAAERRIAVALPRTNEFERLMMQCDGRNLEFARTQLNRIRTSSTMSHDVFGVRQTFHQTDTFSRKHINVDDNRKKRTVDFGWNLSLGQKTELPLHNSGMSHSPAFVRNETNQSSETK